MRAYPALMVGVSDACWLMYIPALKKIERTVHVTWFEHVVTREQRAAINWGASLTGEDLELIKTGSVDSHSLQLILNIQIYYGFQFNFCSARPFH